MKLPFKLKIALLSFALSGTLLTAFGTAFFAYTYSSGIDRIDRELYTLFGTQARGGHSQNHWENFGESLRVIHEGRTEQMVLLVLDWNDGIIYQTDHTPSQLIALPRPESPDPKPRKRRRFNRRFIERLDLDQDDKVSFEEFDGPTHMFGRHDLNSDGFIDREEAQQIERFAPPREDGPPPHVGRGLGPQKPETLFQSIQIDGAHWRVGTFVARDSTVIAAIDMVSFNAELSRIRNGFMLSVPLGLLLLGLVGWFLAGRAIKPISIIARTAEGITAKGLDQRIPEVGTDAEIERLVTVANSMLDRLEKSYNQAVRFSADAAHELQTPLTILQGELDNAIQSSDDGSIEQQRYSMLLEELRNLKAVVQKLLLLAHADEGRLNLNPQPVPLDRLIADAAEDLEIMAPGLAVEIEAVNNVQIQADPALLNQVIRNMTSNAAKYTDPGGTVRFSLQTEKQAVCFTLANTAAPIPDQDRALLFERFHRVDKARTSAGSGLGLSLAREIARAHHGDLILNAYSNGMISFSLSLPLE